MTSFYLIYASVSGNTELVMDYCRHEISQAGHIATLFRAERMPTHILESGTHFIFGVSTWEHGEINPHFLPFLEFMGKQSLNGKKAAFVGLGDTRYEPELFCAGIDRIQKTFINQGGEELLPTLKLNGEPQGQIDERVRPWVLELVSKI
ncbi:flavodoxin family protein [Candidatus Dojkabacteria bacterium]|uniref:Flavodoxin family protein n=1 Tax=Candidatus Dojkabacteria bacterium TaxID=2099670 RepID=A0A955RKL2_9BACT|nr:flavodoxin family protein [Candidatus Dojkabacteria bacterium]